MIILSSELQTSVEWEISCTSLINICFERQKNMLSFGHNPVKITLLSHSAAFNFWGHFQFKGGVMLPIILCTCFQKDINGKLIIVYRLGYVILCVLKVRPSIIDVQSSNTGHGIETGLVLWQQRLDAEDEVKGQSK